MHPGSFRRSLWHVRLQNLLADKVHPEDWKSYRNAWLEIHSRHRSYGTKRKKGIALTNWEMLHKFRQNGVDFDSNIVKVSGEVRDTPGISEKICLPWAGDALKCITVRYHNFEHQNRCPSFCAYFVGFGCTMNNRLFF